MDDILSYVRKIVNKDRQDLYGNPENSFRIIADFWTTYLRHKYNILTDLEPKDIAIMLSLLKHARMVVQGNYEDNVVDAIGYLTILGERLID
ncbi:MAG TPA: DUF6378 domain-containing protein [Caldisericia bacterium]|mgnify:CR=1 FL=1|nr:DUF6378 domain-containing protein [Caldisericia bacterium]